MDSDIKETDSLGQLRAINDELSAKYRHLSQCDHGGDHEVIHKEAAAWCIRQAEAIEANGGNIGMGMARLQAEGHKRFPGCAHAAPLIVMIQYIALPLTRGDATKARAQQ